MKNIKPQALIFWHRFLRCVKPASKGFLKTGLHSALTSHALTSIMPLPSLYPTSLSFWGHIKEPGEPALTLVKTLKFCRMLLTLVNMASLILNKYPQFIWWQTVLEIEISCNQWEGSAYTQSAQIFKFLSFGSGGKDFFFHFSFVPNMFLSSSQWVP
jgi:hypothetical protein